MSSVDKPEAGGTKASAESKAKQAESQTSILVVEDEPSLKAAIVQWLQEIGHEVAFTDNGIAAIKMMKEVEFDALILNYGIPGVTGMRVLEETHRVNPDIFCIMTTLKTDPMLEDESRRKGAHVFLRKPFTASDLVKALTGMKPIRKKGASAARPGDGRPTHGPLITKGLMERVVTSEEAVRVVKSGQRVFLPISSGAPQTLVKALIARAHELEEVEIIHMSTLGPAPYTTPEMEGHFRHNAIFVGGNVREAVNSGRADYTPVFYGEIPSVLREKLPIDVAFIQVSPPDAHGYSSYGVAVDCTKPAAESAKIIVAEINSEMPRTLGDCFIHVDQMDYIVPTSYPLIEMHPPPIDDETMAIGQNIAELVRDGDTLQLGIGAIPDAVLRALGDKRDLGIHSEMISDGVIDLVHAGIITCRRKNLHSGKIIVTFLMGTKNLYGFAHNNPLIEIHPVDYVNDPFVIAQNDNMVAINSAIQVDCTGQVSADSMGYRFYSGFGGQVDFIRGAARSRGGRPIIALPSTAKGGQISRIVPYLYEGGGVVTTRADVHYVVTEYGVADLFGKSIRQRARELIRLAHPDFREELTAAAQEHYHI